MKKILSALSTLDDHSRLVEDIRTFVGKNSVIHFPEGYHPFFNMSAISDEYIDLQYPVGKNRQTRFMLKDLSTDILKNIIAELFDYFVRQKNNQK